MRKLFCVALITVAFACEAGTPENVETEDRAAAQAEALELQTELQCEAQLANGAAECVQLRPDDGDWYWTTCKGDTKAEKDSCEDNAPCSNPAEYHFGYGIVVYSCPII